MKVHSADEVAGALDYKALVDAIDEMFRAGCEMPVRHHHAVETSEGPDATLLLMPAWQKDRMIAVKLVTIFPSNGEKGLPAVMGNVFLIDGTTGEPKAILEGKELTVRRTACASALASRYLSREDSTHLLMVGTGAMAPHLVRAHAAVRSIDTVTIWGRDPAKAQTLASELSGKDLMAQAADDLEAAVAEADIISCATLSNEPLIRGAWLKPGQHVDLVGAFLPTMRETDDEAITRARVYVDTFDGALKEGGDIVQPMADGVLTRADLQGDFFTLARGETKGREGAGEITLFKSVGTALEDLAAAMLAAKKLGV